MPPWVTLSVTIYLIVTAVAIRRSFAFPDLAAAKIPRSSSGPTVNGAYRFRRVPKQ